MAFLESRPATDYFARSVTREPRNLTNLPNAVKWAFGFFVSRMRLADSSFGFCLWKLLYPDTLAGVPPEPPGGFSEACLASKRSCQSIGGRR